MEENKPHVNTIIETLNDEVASILKDKDASDSIVDGLCNVFKDLEIYKKMVKNIDVLTEKNKRLEDLEKELTEKLNTATIEKNLLTEQLNNWRTNTGTIMDANVQALGQLMTFTPTNNNKEKIESESSVDTNTKIDAEGNIKLMVKNDEKKKGIHTLQDIKEEEN
jgi:hypothetical protein